MTGQPPTPAGSAAPHAPVLLRDAPLQSGIVGVDAHNVVLRGWVV